MVEGHAWNRKSNGIYFDLTPIDEGCENYRYEVIYELTKDIYIDIIKWKYPNDYEKRINGEEGLTLECIDLDTVNKFLVDNPNCNLIP